MASDLDLPEGPDDDEGVPPADEGPVIDAEQDAPPSPGLGRTPMPPD